MFCTMADKPDNACHAASPMGQRYEVAPEAARLHLAAHATFHKWAAELQREAIIGLYRQLKELAK